MCVCCGVHFDAKVSSVFLYVSQRMQPEDVRNSLVQSLDRCKFIFFRSESRVGVVCVTRALHVTVRVCVCFYVCVSGKTCVHASVVCACKCCANFQVINFECVAVRVRYWLAINNWM